MAQPVFNKLTMPEKAYQLTFIWQGDTVNKRFEKHSALLIPVKLSGCPKTFYMQFDLGSPYSLLYKKKIQTIVAAYPKTKAMITEASTARAILELGTAEIEAKAIFLRDFGTTEVDFKTKTPQIIGTLGVDLFDGKVLDLNYPGQKITISPKLTIKQKKENFISFTYTQRSLLLPAILQGKNTMLFFDTGSSRYALLTDEKTARSLSMENEPPVASKASSWDRVLTANTLPTSFQITIANQNLPLKTVSYMQGASSAQIDMMVKLGIGGMTGNKLFLNYRLIIDTQNKKFTLVKIN